MPNRFSRVVAVDPSRVTVRLEAATGGRARGDVIGPAGTGYRLGDAGDLSVDEALAVGCALANRYGLEVVVMDESGLWPSRWGELADGAA